MCFRLMCLQPFAVTHPGIIVTKGLKQWFLTGRRAPNGGVKKFRRGREPLRALLHGKLDQ